MSRRCLQSLRFRLSPLCVCVSDLKPFYTGSCACSPAALHSINDKCIICSHSFVFDTFADVAT